MGTGKGINHGSHWSNADVQRLIEFRIEGISYPNIGKRMKRTETAVKNKARMLGLDVMTPRQIANMTQPEPGFPKQVKCLVCREPLTIESRNDPRRHTRCRSLDHYYMLHEGVAL